MHQYSPANGGRAGPYILSYQLDASHLASCHDSQPFQVMRQGQLSPEARCLVEAVVESLLNDRSLTGIRIPLGAFLPLLLRIPGLPAPCPQRSSPTSGPGPGRPEAAGGSGPEAP